MFENKRIMVLGGSNFQLPLIMRAKEMGLYVISCDYLPDNPGHKFSDEYHNVSTTDKKAVLELSRSLNIDAIITFSSDPAIPTVAYVADELGLSGPSPEAVITLSEKDKFRSLISKLGLNVPGNYVVNSLIIPEEIKNSKSKFVVKPIDSSGSKGITYSSANENELSHAIEYALQHSRAKRCIIEEYIDGDQIHGDGYLQDGKLIYHYLGDHFFYTKSKNFIPISTRWPCKYEGTEILNVVVSQVESICKAAGYRTGPVNIEARVTDSGKVYIIEVSPRNGGNYVPIIQEHLTGFDFVSKIIYSSMGMDVKIDTYLCEKKVGAHYILHSETDGIFKGIRISDEINGNIFFSKVFKNKRDNVKEYVGSNTTIGVILMKFSSVQERDYLMSDIKNFIQVVTL
ncbi:ATP-grasp domain-containing protein [Methanolobus bombayensis]|uniref:ATP-grasp domain-containing protein n=1 Tax=Methanolobus bombayensis TaxID=38023 RepID=UPI001AE34BB7|nr:ATP-grasp domain-containing protein [Methanolobus bombayensis]MBP1910299.1 biotin carboxylase [Methanolobus bombayensis]